MTAAYRLKSDGKPMRALRALAGTTPAHPMTELGVACRAERIGEHTPWHRPLRALVDRSLAERSGVRGEYMWHITREGLDLLTVEDAKRARWRVVNLVHPALQTIRGMCTDEAPATDIDRALALAVQMAKRLEDRVAELELLVTRTAEELRAACPLD